MAGGYGFGLTGWPAARGTFVRMGAKADVVARRNVEELSMRLIKYAKDNFEGSHKKGRPHVGGPKPNIVTGNLRRSIQSQGITSVGPATYKVTVGPTAKYGRRVELGYSNRSRPYPYFGPASLKVRSEAQGIAMENWLELWKA